MHPNRITMERSQLNLRISEQLAKLIDAKRIELSVTMGSIPSRSDILRFALEKYLEQDLSEIEVDRRRTSATSTKD
jgi:Arc/MetJ-type ribon-helix-helix transcriptional regulator